MAQALTLPPPGFEKLTIDEKVDYVQSLWERVAAGPESVPVPDWHRRLLAERLEAYRRDLDPGEPFETVLARTRQQLAERRTS